MLLVLDIVDAWFRHALLLDNVLILHRSPHVAPNISPFGLTGMGLLVADHLTQHHNQSSGIGSKSCIFENADDAHSVKLLTIADKLFRCGDNFAQRIGDRSVADHHHRAVEFAVSLAVVKRRHREVDDQKNPVVQRVQNTI